MKKKMKRYISVQNIAKNMKTKTILHFINTMEFVNSVIQFYYINDYTKAY